MAMFFKTPFAQNGDRQAIPDASQIDGSLSYTDGFTEDYQGDYPVDPTAKPVPRLSMNEVLYESTLAIQQYQTHGFPDFITTVDNGGSPYPYDVNAIVRYDPGSGVQLYISLVNNNTSLPTDTTRWAVFNTGQYARVVNTTSQIIAVSPRLVNFNAASLDPFGLFVGSSALLPKVPNGYRIGAYVTIIGLPQQKNIALLLYKNGAAYSELDFVTANNTQTGGTVFLKGSDVASANGTSDFFQIFLQFDGADGVTISAGGCYFNIDSA